MKQLLRNLILILFLGCIAQGSPLSQNEQNGMPIIGWVVTVEVVMLTLAYFVAAVVNHRVLIPRLLVRGRLVSYIFSLAGWSMLFIVIEICFEWLLVGFYHLPRESCWFLEGDLITTVLRILSSLAAFWISMLGIAILSFIRLWEQSGNRMNDMEERNAQSEVERARTSIDSEALFATLDRAAGQIEQTPTETAAMLMELSKSLRGQLYESHRKPPPDLPDPPASPFGPGSGLMTGRRHHLLMHAIMIGWFVLIAAGDINFNDPPPLWEALLPVSSYLFLVYLNLCVLVPRLMLRGKSGAYLTAVVLSAVTIAIPVLMVYLKEMSFDDQMSPLNLALFSIGSMLKLMLPLFGVSVLVLFRRWVLNERRTVELHTATLLSELEQLQNQVNPHFLFNMLNNIIVLVKTDPERAAEVIRKLSDMLKYQFHGFTRQSIRLGDDIHFLTDYLNLEKLRRDNFEFSITTDSDMEEISLPPLLFIPFVENAVKHNNDNRNLSFVRLRFGLKNGLFCFECINSKPLRQMRNHEVGGLGLPNVRRRLNLLYGDRHRLKITENDITYSVQLNIELKNKKI